MQKPPDLIVLKASGEQEAYRRDKLVESLVRTGVPVEFRDRAINYVEDRLFPGIQTREIYYDLRKFLKRTHRPSASRYSLKQALFQLGPSGHPFEIFVGALFEKLGYAVAVDQIVQGKCVTHEVDVTAQKNGKHFIMECKFHNRQGIKTDVKVVLYVWARFRDIVSAWQEDPGHRREYHQAWVVSNTRCTSDAYQYGQCQKMRVVSWDRPSGEGLRELVNQTNLHPLTCLSTLAVTARNYLLEKGIVHVQQFLEIDPELIKDLPVKVIEPAKDEARLLLG